MPQWDDRRYGAPRREFERERGRAERSDRYGQGPERRPFDDPPRGARGVGVGPEMRERDRYAQRMTREDWARRDAGAAGYRNTPELDEDHRFGGSHYHGGQEFGMESHRGEAGGGGGSRHDAGWGFSGDRSRERNFDRRDPGVGQSQAGYRAHTDHDFDPDYVTWRDEQLRGHDRDYSEWRRHQHAQYDDQYRQYRSERREHFGRSFHDWRSQRSAAGGAPDPSGKNVASQAAGGAPGESELGKTPTRVQAAADGDVRGSDHETDKAPDEGRRH